MKPSIKWLVGASIVNLLGNALGTIVSLKRNLAADWGGSLNGQDVLRDFLGLKGTALSARCPSCWSSSFSPGSPKDPVGPARSALVG